MKISLFIYECLHGALYVCAFVCLLLCVFVYQWDGRWVVAGKKLSWKIWTTSSHAWVGGSIVICINKSVTHTVTHMVNAHQLCRWQKNNFMHTKHRDSFMDDLSAAFDKFYKWPLLSSSLVTLVLFLIVYNWSHPEFVVSINTCSYKREKIN